jgi:outer membrane immunogenic protein
MRKLLLSMAAGAALFVPAAAPVSAADLAVRSGGPAPVYTPAPAFSWTGAYIGGNVGGIWGKHDFDPITATQTAGVGGGCPTCGFSATSDRDSALIGGFQSGYRWQTGMWVLGIEQDFLFTNVHNQVALTTNMSLADGSFLAGDTFNAKLKWLGDTRAQLGMAFDRWLVYAAGGLATGAMDVTASYGPRAGGSAAYSITDDNKWHIGWTAGAGLEYAITDNVSLGAEYRYTELSSRTYNLGGTTLSGRTFQNTADVDFKSHAVLARLNIKTAPLMAMFGIR